MPLNGHSFFDKLLLVEGKAEHLSIVGKNKVLDAFDIKSIH